MNFGIPRGFRAWSKTLLGIGCPVFVVGTGLSAVTPILPACHGTGPVPATNQASQVKSEKVELRDSNGAPGDNSVVGFTIEHQPNRSVAGDLRIAAANLDVICCNEPFRRSTCRIKS